jgi:molybdopterin converting factor small subunit
MSLRLQGATVGDVIQALADLLPVDARRLLIDKELNDPRPNALILLNGKEISVLDGLKTRIDDGDEVTLIPVSHGG